MSDTGSPQTCMWPGCDQQIDIVAVFTGEVQAPGWLGSWGGYLCPEHGAAGHLPRLVGGDVECGCGTWKSMETLAWLREQWQRHVAGMGVDATTPDAPAVRHAGGSTDRGAGSPTPTTHAKGR